MSSHNEYRQFFMKAMEKFNINSPSDLHSDDQKKKFFNYIDKNWKSTSEEAEVYVDEIAEANAFLKARAVAIWEGNDEFEFNGKVYPVIKVAEETE
jgi:hypothetical protein